MATLEKYLKVIEKCYEKNIYSPEIIFFHLCEAYEDSVSFTRTYRNLVSSIKKQLQPVPPKLAAVPDAKLFSKVPAVSDDSSALQKIFPLIMGELAVKPLNAEGDFAMLLTAFLFYYPEYRGCLLVNISNQLKCYSHLEVVQRLFKPESLLGMGAASRKELEKWLNYYINFPNWSPEWHAVFTALCGVLQPQTRQLLIEVCIETGYCNAENERLLFFLIPENYYLIIGALFPYANEKVQRLIWTMPPVSKASSNDWILSSRLLSLCRSTTQLEEKNVKQDALALFNSFTDFSQAKIAAMRLIAEKFSAVIGLTDLIACVQRDMDIIPKQVNNYEYIKKRLEWLLILNVELSSEFSTWLESIIRKDEGFDFLLILAKYVPEKINLSQAEEQRALAAVLSKISVTVTNVPLQNEFKKLCVVLINNSKQSIAAIINFWLQEFGINSEEKPTTKDVVRAPAAMETLFTAIACSSKTDGEMRRKILQEFLAILQKNKTSLIEKYYTNQYGWGLIANLIHVYQVNSKDDILPSALTMLANLADVPAEAKDKATPPEELQKNKFNVMIKKCGSVYALAKIVLFKQMCLPTETVKLLWKVFRDEELEFDQKRNSLDIDFLRPKVVNELKVALLYIALNYPKERVPDKNYLLFCLHLTPERYDIEMLKVVADFFKVKGLNEAVCNVIGSVVPQGIIPIITGYAVEKDDDLMNVTNSRKLR